jgi:hypothetical protein
MNGHHPQNSHSYASICTLENPETEFLEMPTNNSILGHDFKAFTVERSSSCGFSTVCHDTQESSSLLPFNITSKMEETREFLDFFAKRYAALEKENESLRQKLKVYEDDNHPLKMAWEIQSILAENNKLRTEVNTLKKTLETKQVELNDSGHNIGMLQGLLAMVE